MLIDELTTEQQAILLASILADGEITKCYPGSRRKNNSYREHFGENQRFYREWKQQALPELLYIRTKNLVSKSLPLFTELFPHYYPLDKKTIPFDLLTRCTHPLFLLVLYLDDGSLMISKRLNQKNQLYVTPSIALYLQSFPKDVLVTFSEWLNETFDVKFRLSGIPSGHGHFLKTTKVEDTLSFLKKMKCYIAELPDFAYKLDWETRLEAIQSDFPHSTLITSLPARPYTEQECNFLTRLKQQGLTDQEIATTLGRSYWSVVYKLRQLKKAMDRSP
ncbi:endonuclease [Exiguobacterium flavidum]|uniref:endonuclease n=1 Tax=Exiguobacterium flavidum TaxID=2184695 RepID=UPI000DF7DAEB|nr:endonuclease [Exiguobacterium flavidum]